TSCSSPYLDFAPAVSNDFLHMTPTTYYPYRHGQLCCESVPLTKLADAVGTPAYVYSKAALLDSYRAYDHAFKDVPHLICYSIKANSNLAVIATLARAGAGADIVSGGELQRALRAGVPAKKSSFSGAGKTRDEMRDALKAEILLVNVESVGELRALDEVARELGTRAPVALRVNPDVDPQTHKYIATGLKSAKFGIPHTHALAAYEEAAGLRGLQVVGADMHIGSQLTKALPLGDAVARVAALVKQLRERGVEITTIDVGGGLGIRYRDETPPTHAEYATVLLPALKELGVTVLLEPGRSIVALVTPFKNGKVDEAKLRELVELHVANGTDGLVPCGTTGESPTLSHDEHKRVVEVVVEATRKRIKVVAGTGSNCTTEALDLTKHAERVGADGALVVNPY